MTHLLIPMSQTNQKESAVVTYGNFDHISYSEKKIAWMQVRGRSSAFPHSRFKQFMTRGKPLRNYE